MSGDCWPDGVLCACAQLRDLALELCRRQAADELLVGARVPGAVGHGPTGPGLGAGRGGARDDEEDPDEAGPGSELSGGGSAGLGLGSDPGPRHQAARRQGLGRSRGVQASLDRYFPRAGAHPPGRARDPGWAGPSWPSQ